MLLCSVSNLITNEGLALAFSLVSDEDDEHALILCEKGLFEALMKLKARKGLTPALENLLNEVIKRLEDMGMASRK